MMRANVITGTPGLLVRLATAMPRNHAGAVRPRFVISGGEVLTGPMKRVIADAFGAPVYDLYGSYEFGPIGWECPRAGGFHVADDWCPPRLIHAPSQRPVPRSSRTKRGSSLGQSRGSGRRPAKVKKHARIDRSSHPPPRYNAGCNPQARTTRLPGRNETNTYSSSFVGISRRSD
jgi:hypothetical protein